MKRGLFQALVLLAPGILLAQSPAPTTEKTLIVTHVTVIDATGSPAKPNQSVLIRAHKIVSVSQTGLLPIPEGAQIVDGTGKFMIPGLWDMHVHTGRREIYLPLYLANGITGVRDMGGDLEDGTGELAGLSARYVQLRLWRLAVERGTFLGPRIVTAGFLIDGFKWPGNVCATNAEEGRQAVQVLKEIGVDFIKVKSFLSREAYFAIADEARLQHVPLAGHVPDAISAEEASDAGQRSIEHLTGIMLGTSGEERRLMDERVKAFAARDRAAYSRVELRAAEMFDESVSNALFARFVKNGTWQVPTLVELRKKAPDTTLAAAAENPRWSYLPKSVRAWWNKDRAEPGSETGQRVFASEMALTHKMHSAGVLFMAGTDSPNPSVLPGFSLHEELKLLVAAGLTPMEALQAATRNPALYLGRTQDLGTVEAGKLADLLLLDANPLDDISNTQKISAVVVNGSYLSRSDLDMLLNDVKRAAQ